MASNDCRARARTLPRVLLSVSGVSALALLAAVPALAQQPAQVQPNGVPYETGESVELDPITVVATRTEQSWIDTLAGVSVVRQEQIEQLMPTRTADLFQGMPGVGAIQNGNTQQTSINIRGLQDFGRVAVIVDGARQNFTQLGHSDSAGTFMVEPGLIAGVDVVRGPVSNIYGSGAIGGVVTMRTFDAQDLLRDGETWAVRTDAEGATNGPMGFGSVMGAARIGQNVDVFAGGTFREADDYEDGNGDTVPDTGYQTWTGIAKLTVRPADFHEIKLTASNFDSQYDTSNDIVDASTTIYATDVATQTVTASYNYSNPDDNLFDWRSTAYWNRVDQDQTKIAGTCNAITGCVGDPRSFTIDTYGFDANNTSRFELGAVQNALTFGGDFFRDEVSNSDDFGFGDGYNPSGNRNVGGAFVQLQSNYATWLQTIVALRYDAYELNGTDALTGDSVTNDGDRLSPKFTVGVTPWDWLTVYATYAEGYRAPAVTETLVSGVHPPTGGPPFAFIPNPNLQAEIGKNKEVGVNLKKDGLFVAGDQFRAKANYYRNDVDDYIEAEIVSPGPLCSGPYAFCYQYENISSAKLEGFEFESTYDARKWFAGLNAQVSEGEDAETGDPLYSVMPNTVTGTIGARFLDEKLTVALRWTWVAAKSEDDLPPPDPRSGYLYDPTDSFNLVSIYAGYQQNPNTLWRLSVENLLDEQYTQYQNFLPSAGLTVKGGVTVRFGGGQVAAVPPLVTK